ncbi:uncharacterized protein [Typha latifolia]|uniref:uncharacterized protein n=1 Tax=Typha latifolia TaxID=4733 RepID=UPI003C2F7418
MTVVPLESLPLGFRFHPTDEELVNHYLKGKITGRIKSEVEVIPEVDVCKCEPWDLPDKALIRSDDPEWFFFAPKDRKYPNGHRSNRATEAGYWKATGKDRFIRSKPAAKHAAIIGMKKTLVFHRGRAPKGVRTNWIIHEYRTTEPEFESGDQGGYVLYRLFKKPEEKSLSSDLEIDRNISPTPTRSSPDDIQHDAMGMEEIATPLNQESPASALQDDPLTLLQSIKTQSVGIKSWLDDKPDCSATYHIKPDLNYCKIASNSHAGEAGVKGSLLQDSLAQFVDAEHEKIEPDRFPNISSPPLPYTDHPFFGNINQGSHMEYLKVCNSSQDSLDVLLNSMLTNQDEISSRGSIVLKDSADEVVPQQNIFDLSSYKDNGASSNLDAKRGFVQGAVGLDVSDWPYPHCVFGTEELQMDISDEYPEMKPRLSTLYEDINLLPYDSTGQDVYSVVSAAESSNQKNMTSNGDCLEQQTDANTIVAEQGSATRRIRLQCSVQHNNSNSESNSSHDDREVEEASTHFLELSGIMERLNIKRIPINGASNETGITIRARRLRDPSSSNKLVGEKGKPVRRLQLQSKLQVGAFSRTNGLSRRGNNICAKRVAKDEVGKHVDQNNLEGGNKLQEFSFGDVTPPVKIFQEARPTRSSRKRYAGSNIDIVKCARKSSGSSIIWVSKGGSAASLYIFLPFLSVILLLLYFGMWGRSSTQYAYNGIWERSSTQYAYNGIWGSPSTQYAYKSRGYSTMWVWRGDSAASFGIFLSFLSVILFLLCVGIWRRFWNTQYASKLRDSSNVRVWKGDSVASSYIFYSSLSVILLLLYAGIWMFMNNQCASKPRGSPIIWVWKGDSVASLYIILSFLSVILLLLCFGTWRRFTNTQSASKPRGSIIWVW